MRTKNIFAVIAAAFLFLALFDGWPYGYFTLLRLVVCAVAVYCAYLAYGAKQEKWAWAFGIVAVLFNPIIPVHLDRETWSFIDFVTGVFLIVSAYTFKLEGADVAGKSCLTQNQNKGGDGFDEGKTSNK